MRTLQNENGPAEVAASPSHGSSKSLGGKPMNTHDHSTAALGNPETPDIGDVIDMISHARGVIELVNMAARSSEMMRGTGTPISWGCMHAREILKEAIAALETKLGVAA
jgi:hypothetical protein